MSSSMYHSIEDNATGDLCIDKLKSRDPTAVCQDPCPRDSLTRSTSQTPSDAELPRTNLFEAPLCLEINHPSARPQDAEFSRETDDLENEGSITQQEDVGNENNLIEKSGGCGDDVLPLSCAPTGPEISTETEEYSHLVQKGLFSHHEESSPSKEKSKQPTHPRGRKAFSKAAAKGRKIFNRVFNRRN